MTSQEPCASIEWVPIWYGHLRNCLKAGGSFFRASPAEIRAGPFRVGAHDAEVRARLERLVADSGGYDDHVAR